MTGASPGEDKEEGRCDSTSVVLFDRRNHLATRLAEALLAIVMFECLPVECYSSYRATVVRGCVYVAVEKDSIDV